MYYFQRCRKKVHAVVFLRSYKNKYKSKKYRRNLSTFCFPSMSRHFTWHSYPNPVVLAVSLKQWNNPVHVGMCYHPHIVWICLHGKYHALSCWITISEANTPCYHLSYTTSNDHILIHTHTRRTQIPASEWLLICVDITQCNFQLTVDWVDGRLFDWAH